MRVRGEGLPAPDRETPAAGCSRPCPGGRVDPVMALLCGPRRCGALLALLASLLLFGAEAADGERGVHGEGPGGFPGRQGRPEGRRRGVRGKVWWGGGGGPRGPGRGRRGEAAGEGSGGDSTESALRGWSSRRGLGAFGSEDGRRSQGWQSFLRLREETRSVDQGGVAAALPVAGREGGERPNRRPASSWQRNAPWRRKALGGQA